MFDFLTFIPRAIMQGIPLLYGSTGETLTEKSGNLNLGIPGIMYVGAISGVIGAFFYESSVSPETFNGLLAVLITLLATLLGSLLMGLLYCFLTVTLRANQNVTGLAMTTFGVGFGNFFGGSLIKLSGNSMPYLALTNTSLAFQTKLPGADTTGWFGQLFLSYGFLAYLAVILSLIAAYVLKRTRIGLHLRAVGENPATADAAGISVNRYKYAATCIGSMIAGLGGLYYVMDYAGGIGDYFLLPVWRTVYPAYVYPDGYKPGDQGTVQDGALCGNDHRADYIQHPEQTGESAPGKSGIKLFQRRKITQIHNSQFIIHNYDW